jgi:phage gp36-like protein
VSIAAKTAPSSVNEIDVLDRTDAGVLELYVGDGLGGWATVPVSTPGVDWFFWAVVYEAGGTVRAYFAAPGNAPTETGNATYAAWVPTFIEIGDDGWGEWLEGDVQSVRVYAAALSAAELATEMNSIGAVRTSGLWADWQLIDASLADSSGNARPLTAQGGPIASTSSAPISEPETYTGTLAVATGSPTLAGAGQATGPGATGTLDVSAATVTFSAAGTTGLPSYEGAMAVTSGSPTVAAAGAYDAPGAGGTMAVSSAPPTFSASGAYSVPSRAGTLAVSATSPTLASAGAVTYPGVSGALAVSAGSPALAVGGSTQAPIYSGALAVSSDAPTVTATGQTQGPAVNGVLGVTAQSPTLAGTGGATSPGGSYAIWTTKSPTFSASGAFSVPARSGTLDVSAQAPTISSAGSATGPIYAGSMVVSVGSPTLAGAGGVTLPTITGTAALTASIPSLAGTGTRTVPSVSGAMAITSQAPTLSGAGNTLLVSSGTLAVSATQATMGATGVTTGPITADAMITQLDLELEYGEEQVRQIFALPTTGQLNVARLTRAIASASDQAKSVLLKSWTEEQIGQLAAVDEGLRSAVCSIAMWLGAKATPAWRGSESPYESDRENAFEVLQSMAAATLRSVGETTAGANPNATPALVTTRSTPQEFTLAPSKFRPQRGGF